ncbi:uncharacterized protein mlip isoform 2-T2 [Odontesthes bonariensis]|uniref:uncharacterized protein mlip isoform X2 n=1 Tax=Odontesthes bonariensis TaxID=219752 RepID=UPI003F58D849
MDHLNNSVRKVPVGAPAKPATFTFVPAVQKLPIKSLLVEEERFEVLTGKSDKNIAVSHERTTGENMSDGQIFKAKIVFIEDILERGAGNTAQLEAKPQFKPLLNHVSLPQTKASPSVRAWSENTPNHRATGTVSMETADGKHWGISRRQCQDTSGHAEVSLGCFPDRSSVSEDRTSPLNSADLFSTPASSRESILSEGSDKKSWTTMLHSSVTSPVSFSRTVSPCSSIRSGVFSPAVVQIKRHFLAPGSSLLHIPQTCFSSCDSLSSSTCPQTPTPRHRPPLTRLSLLTAILRKGRLPVLSPALQRPYTPCWPVNPVTLSFCNACSAATSVASIPLDFSSQFSSSASIDSQNPVHKERNNYIPAFPTVETSKHKRMCLEAQVTKCSELIGSGHEEHGISPPPVSSSILHRTPLPLLPNFKSVSPPKHEKSDSATTLHSSISKLPELKPSNTHIFLKDHTDSNFKKLISQSSKLINETETSVPQKWTRHPNSSLSKLHLLSQQLRSPPARTDTTSPLSPLQNTTRVGGCESVRSCPVSRSVTPSQASRKAYCLSPSRYTPIVFSGWPSPTNSPTPTPSPGPPIRDFTPSPSLSLCSMPPSRPGSGMSDCSDRDGKKRKQTYKIKLSYKSLAAIPTNTLLLDQQVIDEQVEREQSHCDTPNRRVTDTHTEMCSPAQLRQQSEELYAVIDEILENSIPTTSKSSTAKAGFQHSKSSLPKSLGRETKYASVCSLHPTANKERKFMDPKKIKPGVIRPMTAIPRLTVKVEDEFHPNSFRQFVKQTLTDKEKMKNMGVEEAQTDLYAGSKGKIRRDEMTSEKRGSFSACELHIKEPDEQIRHLAKESSAPFSTTEKQRLSRWLT